MASLVEVSLLASRVAAAVRTATAGYYASRTAAANSELAMSFYLSKRTLSTTQTVSSSTSPTKTLFLLLVVVIVVPLLVSLKTHKPQSLGRYQSKRYSELDGLSTFEIVIEWAAAVITTFQKKAYRSISANTCGASVISLRSKRFIIAHPSMERSLGKYVGSTSLAHNTHFFGSPMFGLGDDGIRRIKEYDPRPVHKEAFSGTETSGRLAGLANDYAQRRIDREPDAQETRLGIWLFKIINATLITTIWGPENPWIAGEEEGLLDRLVTFSFLLPTLLRPWPKWTARRALEARDDVLAYLRSYHAKHREMRAQQLGHDINVVAMTDPSWETNDDYFKTELLTLQGLTVTPSAMTVWLVRHLLADEPTLRRVIAQVRHADVASPDAGRVNVGAIRKTCPLLVASLYEAMRLHMTAIPRIAKEDFETPMTGAAHGSTLCARKSDIILLPMTSFNLDPRTWGPNVGRFAPDRFLTADGSVSEAALRRLRVFGVASNMCPGRRLGLDAVLFVAATVLRTFDLEPSGGDSCGARFPPPVASNEPGIGFERVGDDVQVTIRRVKATSC